jgi:hypothetical protein
MGETLIQKIQATQESGRVSLGGVHSALASPSPVAVGNESDVLGQSLPVMQVRWSVRAGVH